MIKHFIAHHLPLPHYFSIISKREIQLTNMIQITETPCPEYMHLLFYCEVEIIHFLIPSFPCSISHIHVFLMIFLKYKENKKNETLEGKKVSSYSSLVCIVLFSFLSLVSYEWLYWENLNTDFPFFLSFYHVSFSKIPYNLNTT